jgi:hypothetical protein
MWTWSESRPVAGATGGGLESYPDQNGATGCHSDHVLGQWWAHSLGLGHLLGRDRVRGWIEAVTVKLEGAAVARITYSR